VFVRGGATGAALKGTHVRLWNIQSVTSIRLSSPAICGIGPGPICVYYELSPWSTWRSSYGRFSDRINGENQRAKARQQKKFMAKYPDEAARQLPVGFVVRRKGWTIDEAELKDLVGKQPTNMLLQVQVLVIMIVEKSEYWKFGETNSIGSFPAFSWSIIASVVSISDLLKKVKTSCSESLQKELHRLETLK
ncbi:hypothetical protein Tco_1401087, partial [Tanacetum coccineum]